MNLVSYCIVICCCDVLFRSRTSSYVGFRFSFLRVSSPAGWVGGCDCLRVIKFGARPPPCRTHNTDQTTWALAATADGTTGITFLRVLAQLSMSMMTLQTLAEDQVSPPLFRELNMTLCASWSHCVAIEVKLYTMKSSECSKKTDKHGYDQLWDA